jgi:hypothetical protein
MSKAVAAKAGGHGDDRRSWPLHSHADFVRGAIDREAGRRDGAVARKRELSDYTHEHFAQRLRGLVIVQEAMIRHANTGMRPVTRIRTDWLSEKEPSIDN